MNAAWGCVKAATLTAERVRQLFRYDPETGEMVRLLEKYPFWGVVSEPKFSRGKKAYLIARVDGRDYRVSRLAFMYMNGKWPEHEADHIDGDIHNNKWDNLRDATRKLNAANKAKSRSKMPDLDRWHEAIVNSGRPQQQR